MVNRVTIIGNLGKDPELRHTNAGQEVCSLRVATSRAWTDKASGQRKEETEWFDVEVWGRQASACGEHLAKGRTVYVEGRLKTERWQKDGQERYRTKVIAENVRFIGGRGAPSSSAAPEPQDAGGPDTGPGPDDLPF